MRMSNPHLPKSIYDPVEKNTKLNDATLGAVRAGALEPDGLNNQKYSGLGEKCSYVEIIRARTMCVNSSSTTTGTPKWILPIGIKPVDKRLIQRRSNGVSSVNSKRTSMFGYGRDIKHVSLQPRLLATGDEDDDMNVGEGVIISQKLNGGMDTNHRISIDGASSVGLKTKKSIIDGFGNNNTGDMGDNDEDEDLFAEFAEDIRQAAYSSNNTNENSISNNREAANEAPEASDNSSLNFDGTPSSPAVSRFESMKSSGSGYARPAGGLFIANPDNDDSD